MTDTHPTAPPADEAAHDLACETLYRFLAAALSDPRSEEWRLATDPAAQALAIEAAELLRADFSGESPPLGFGELPVEDLELRPLAAELARPADELRAEYTRVFGLVTCRECPPYETEYHQVDEPFFRAQQMADVAGFYRAFGLEPGTESRERPDHLALELEFAAVLLMKMRLARQGHDAAAAENAAVCAQARESFFRDHLCWWIPSFSLALRNKADHGPYALIGKALAALLPVERLRLGVAAPRMPLVANSIESPDQCTGCALADS